MSLTIEKVSTDAKGALIPLKETDVSKALAGDTETSNKQCLDANSNTVCEVYKIEITNKSSVTVSVAGTLSMKSEAQNIKFQIMQNQTTLGDSDSAHTANQNGDSSAIANLASNQKLQAKGDSEPVEGQDKHTYYVVVWLDDNSQNQNETDGGKDYTGTVTFNGAGENQIQATFSS